MAMSSSSPVTRAGMPRASSGLSESKILIAPASVMSIDAGKARAASSPRIYCRSKRYRRLRHAGDRARAFARSPIGTGPFAVSPAVSPADGGAPVLQTFRLFEKRGVGQEAFEDIRRQAGTMGHQNARRDRLGVPEPRLDAEVRRIGLDGRVDIEFPLLRQLHRGGGREQLADGADAVNGVSVGGDAPGFVRVTEALGPLGRPIVDQGDAEADDVFLAHDRADASV